MDHRCLYGHRVPASFTFAIQSRSCPTCGAPTVSLVGYQAARKLAVEGGIDAVAAFHAVRLLETEWTLTPNAAARPAASPPAPAPVLSVVDEEPAQAAAAGAVAAPAHEEDEVVVDEETVEPPVAPAVSAASDIPDVPDVADVASAPEPRVRPVPRARPKDEKKGPEGAAPRAFEPGEEDFFKGA